MKTLSLPMPLLETLEPRLAPAGVVALSLSSNGTLSITGDAEANDFQITESGNQWTISALEGGTTQFRLNGGTRLDSITFNAPLSVKAVLGGGNDNMVLDNVSLPNSLNVSTGSGDDIVDLTSTSIGGKVTITMSDGKDRFTAGGDLYFGKGMEVSLGKGSNTFDLNAATLLSDGSISARGGGLSSEGQFFYFQTGVGEINGSLSLRTTTNSFTDFEIGDLPTDSLVVTRSMTLEAGSGEDIVILRGDLAVGGLLSLRMGGGDNEVITTSLDQLSSKGLTYTGGKGLDNFILEAREVIIDGTFTFSASSGINNLEVATTEYFGVNGTLSYKGSSGQDTLVLGGPEVYVKNSVSMRASSGSDMLAINAVLGDLGGVRYTGGSGLDRVDIGQTDGLSSVIEIYGSVSINTGTGDADIHIIDSDLKSSLSIITNARYLDEVRLFDSDFRGTVNVDLRGRADSYVEVRDGIFDRNVTIRTGAGSDEVRFDTDTATSSILSWFDGYVRVYLGSGDDFFYAGSNPVVETVGNDFNGPLDVYGGRGYDTALFMDSVSYNNGFNGPIPWAFSVERLA